MPQHKSVSTRDSVVAVKGGAIVCRLAPLPARRGARRHPQARELGMPILRTVQGTGIFEGGQSFPAPGSPSDGRPSGSAFGSTKRVHGRSRRCFARRGSSCSACTLRAHRQHIDGVLVWSTSTRAHQPYHRTTYLVFIREAAGAENQGDRAPSG